ncbi:1-deoxy-D-xylulose-5-phosphate reductoisomerase [Priestia megaterium]|uniref:1-deoxy-D-xylulose-5-phosphate reductoisomerase n=1 Tax=Priestia megaterium TaxID=1404 RepID=UPI0033974650
MKKISILGSTGSIGKSSLEVIKNNLDKFKVIGLAANNDISTLESQVREFSPKIVSVGNKQLAEKLKINLNNSNVKVVYGEEGLIEVATYSEADQVLISVSGAAGIKPTIEAIKSNKSIALANKETLVVAGHLVMDLVKSHKSTIIPVDSEHSAIFQCLNGENPLSMSKLIITASGGAFREKSREEMVKLRAEEALKHPNWSMGNKLTIDSATMLNKGFEVIEAKWLFDVDFNDIEILIHKESIVHSMVQFQDGSVIAQLGIPDMKLPIQYAFSYPSRINKSYTTLSLSDIKSLSFEKPDLIRFPCLDYALNAAKEGGTLPAVLNASSEIANELYLQGKITFLEIERIIYEALNAHSLTNNPNLDEIVEADNWARKYSLNFYKSIITTS